MQDSQPYDNDLLKTKDMTHEPGELEIRPKKSGKIALGIIGCCATPLAIIGTAALPAMGALGVIGLTLVAFRQKLSSIFNKF